MTDFENYKKLITSFSGISSKKVITSTNELHRMSGVVVFGHCLAKIVVECRNYGVGAGMSVDFAIAENKFDFLDKEYQNLRYQLGRALSPYNASNNGVFRIGGGIWINSESQNYWGLSFNDLNKIDAINNKCANDAINCVKSAIGWLFNQSIYTEIYCLYNYFQDKKLLLKF